ncbi:MAG TPA: DUF1697 domain-containing protein [Gemmatimonadaceae bacterium]|jgi:uncharacterized protein (DUF1697 family)|nr:DUF1697 domain-containing protein [Gemmatimonadaceae bacterium]
MSGPGRKFIALLRGINVTGRNKVPMADLRTLCSKNGMTEVETYIQSGNLVVSAAGSTQEIEKQLETLIEKKFKLSIPVIVRRASEWPAYITGNPFPEASATAPNAVMLALSKKKPNAGALAGLRERAVRGERLELVGDALWIHFTDGVANSKLAPGLFDRLVGSPVTTRNWRTVVKLGEMTREASS